MRKTLNLLPSIISIALIMMMVSCSKEGPQGPAGPAGPAGSQGPAGAQGTQGATGTANVIYSNWITPTWNIDTVINNDTSWYVDINAPKLDTAILNRGEIKVYINLSSDPNFPIVFPIPFNNYGLYIDPIFAPNIIELLSNANFTGVPVRYILIPGGVFSGRIGVDWNNYASVKAYLGLKD